MQFGSLCIIQLTLLPRSTRRLRNSLRLEVLQAVAHLQISIRVRQVRDARDNHPCSHTHRRSVRYRFSFLQFTHSPPPRDCFDVATGCGTADRAERYGRCADGFERGGVPWFARRACTCTGPECSMVCGYQCSREGVAISCNEESRGRGEEQGLTGKCGASSE